MELRVKGRPNNDVDQKQLWLFMLIIALICLGVAGLVCGLTILSDPLEDNLAYNERAEAFNALPEADRRLVYEYYAGDDINSETLTMKLKDTSRTMSEILFQSPAFYIILALWVIWPASFAAVYDYDSDRSSYHFYADFPFEHRTDYILFAFIVLGCIPAYIVSLYRLNRFKKSLKMKEAAAVKELSDDKNYMVMATPEAPIACPDKVRWHYVSGRDKGLEANISVLEERIERRRRKILDYTDTIRELQRDNGSDTATIQTLKQMKEDVASREQAQQEIDMICKMRGVAEFDVLKHDSSILLSFLVKVRVPYDGAVYDFGDYKIRISRSSYSCHRVRSGVKIGALSTEPDYGAGGSFCFGQRGSTISEYIQNGRVAEAVALMIDSLHSVNSDEIARQIPLCFRKVDTILQARASA